ncbi:MAG TPA: hypothetical protein VNT79_00535 [Phycisphaerae bacterium]|nr:hypothetical protein [Phycisphaerae bacterium]
METGFFELRDVFVSSIGAAGFFAPEGFAAVRAAGRLTGFSRAALPTAPAFFGFFDADVDDLLLDFAFREAAIFHLSVRTIQPHGLRAASVRIRGRGKRQQDYTQALPSQGAYPF